jgi:hypothetical protein
MVVLTQYYFRLPYFNKKIKFVASRLISGNVKFRVFMSAILPVVLCGWEIWSLTLSEEHRLRVFEDRVIYKVLGSDRNEVTGG